MCQHLTLLLLNLFNSFIIDPPLSTNKSRIGTLLALILLSSADPWSVIIYLPIEITSIGHLCSVRKQNITGSSHTILHLLGQIINRIHLPPISLTLIEYLCPSELKTIN